MGNKDLPPRGLLRVFNQTAPLTARGGDTALAEEDPRVSAGAQRFNCPAALNTSRGVLHGPSDSCVPGHLRTRQRGEVFIWGLARKPGTTWSAREVVFCE